MGGGDSVREGQALKDFGASAAAVLTALSPIALKLIIDDFTGGNRRAAVSPLSYIAFYVLSLWFARTVGELRRLVYARAEQRMFRTLSERLFAHVMHLPLRFHPERKTGAVSQTLECSAPGLPVTRRRLRIPPQQSHTPDGARRQIGRAHV